MRLFLFLFSITIILPFHANAKVEEKVSVQNASLSIVINGISKEILEKDNILITEQIVKIFNSCMIDTSAKWLHKIWERSGVTIAEKWSNIKNKSYFSLYYNKPDTVKEVIISINRRTMAELSTGKIRGYIKCSGGDIVKLFCMDETQKYLPKIYSEKKYNQNCTEPEDNNISMAGYTDSSRNVAIPLIFNHNVNGKNKYIKTSACLPVHEKSINLSWDQFTKTATSLSDKALVTVIDAFINEDENLLLSLIYPEKQESVIKEQISAFSRQLNFVKLKKVNHLYDFEGVISYALEADYQGSLLNISFEFKKKIDGTFGFMLKPSGHSLLLLDTWYKSKWGPTKDNPAYCSQFLLQQQMHKFILDDIKENHGLKSALLMRGQDLRSVATDNKLITTYKNMRKALNNGDFKTFVSYQTEAGKEKINSWIKSITDEEKKQYLEYFQDIYKTEPIYMLNADPLFILYTNTQSSEKIFYFLRDNDGNFKRTKYNVVDGNFDPIFKSEILLKEINKDKPFEKYRLR